MVMATAVEPLIVEQFKGIREYNGINSGGVLSAITCENVELVNSEIGSNTGIKTMEGNTVKYSLPEGYSIKGIFNSNQEGIDYTFIYGENDKKGVLFYINLADKPEILVDNLSKTGNCNGLTMTSSAYDVFVFTNGVEVKTVCFTADSAYGDTVKTIKATDYQKRSIHWLSMTAWNGFLVVASEYGVHSSHQNDIYTWNENPQDIADAWYIDFSKKVTAVFAFTGGLYIFTDDDCSLLTATPNDTTNSSMTTSAGIGCLSYQSIVKHDIYLFFYDNNQKNIYYLSATDTTGQVKPNGPVAKEIQSFFSRIETFRMFSCIYSTRNEIWCLVNDSVLIYDYTQQEWTQRNEQSICTLVLSDNTVITGGDSGDVFVENVNNDFAGQFFPSVYQTTYVNLGSNSNLKKQKTPLLLTLNGNYTNDFYVQLTINGKEKNPKHVQLKENVTARFAPEDDDVEANETECFDSAYFTLEKSYNKTVVEISTPQTWYSISVKLYTEELGQGFYIQSLELKNIKVKTKTKGR
jgi:hypothetical protein